MSVVPAIIAGAGSLLGSLWSNTVGFNQSKQLMQYQQELNQQAIDRQNVYNSPAEQVKRLREANLNENLAFGNGVSGNQSDAKSVGIANRNPQLDTGLVTAIENYFKSQQIENENRSTRQNIRESMSRTALNEQRTLDAMLDNRWKDATMDTRIKQQSANLAHTLQSIKESNQRINESEQRVSNLQSQANLLQEQIKYWDAHAQNEKEFMPDLLRARTWQAMQSGNLSEAQQRVADSLVRLNDQKIEYLVHVIRKLDINAGQDAIDYEIASAMQNFGAAGIKPKDVLDFLLKLLQMGFK